MRKTITTVCGIVGFLVIVCAIANAKPVTESTDILIPLPVSSKGWMQALEDAGYKAAQVCKLRYGDGRLVKGSEARYSPDTVYITFAKDAKVSRSELAAFLQESSGPGRVPVIGEDVMAMKLEREKAEADAQARREKTEDGKSGSPPTPPFEDEGKTDPPQLGFQARINKLVVQHLLALFFLASQATLAAFVGFVFLYRSGSATITKPRTSPNIFVAPEDETSDLTHRSIEKIKKELELDSQILQGRQAAVK